VKRKIEVARGRRRKRTSLGLNGVSKYRIEIWRLMPDIVSRPALLGRGVRSFESCVLASTTPQFLDGALSDKPFASRAHGVIWELVVRIGSFDREVNPNFCYGFLIFRHGDLVVVKTLGSKQAVYPLRFPLCPLW
jgi:hypothetical protein